MTTRTNPLPLALAGSDRFPRRLVFSFLLTALGIAVFSVAFAVGYARAHDGRVVPGVEIAGISLAGLDRPAAEAKLREGLPALSDGRITVRIAASEERIPYAEIGRDYDIGLMLDQAFGVGRDGDLLGRAGEQLRVLLHGITVKPSMTWDAEALAGRVAAVGERAQIEPVDATIIRQAGRYTVVPSLEGRAAAIDRAVRLANAAVHSLSAADTTIVMDLFPVPPQITTAQAQAAVDRLERVAASDLSVSGGGRSTVVDADTLRSWIRLREKNLGQWALVIDHQPIRQLVAQHAAAVDVPVRNATFRFDGAAVAVVPSQTGQAVDVEASTNSILAALEARAAGGDRPSNVILAVTKVEPDFTTEQARQLAFRVERLSRWTTRYIPGLLNYDGRNIAIPTDVIDGTVVEPGETFDFLSAIGDITPENGYGPGAAIIRGRTRYDGAIGGGMCSTSTTLFNAALRAGLEMGERRNHFYYINRYPVGLDATVWIADSGARQTMSFTNDTEHAILIRGINRPGKVTFEIWGVPDGRTVSISEPVVEGRKQPNEQIMYTDKLAPGERKRVESPVIGFKSTVVRTVRDADGNLVHEDTYFSKYHRINGITQVGRSPEDPAHGTLVRVDGQGDTSE